MPNVLHVICCWVENIGLFLNYYSSESRAYMRWLIHVIRITSILLKTLSDWIISLTESQERGIMCQVQRTASWIHSVVIGDKTDGNLRFACIQSCWMKISKENILICQLKQKWASRVAQMVKNLSATWETWVLSLI